MAANYVIAGFAEDRKFAETEILADLMARSLPEFQVKKVIKSKSEWDGKRAPWIVRPHPPSTHLLQDHEGGTAS